MANRNGSARSSSSSRCHIVLVPGFGGFDALGRVEYYSGITALFQDWTDVHRDLPAVLHYFDNLPTAAVVTRAERLRKYLAKRIARREIRDHDGIVLVGHSTGSLDIRQLICDLHNRVNSSVMVDGGLPVSAEEIRQRIHAVVFLSAPHWGTNIAEWVHSHPVLRTTVIANLRVALASSEAYLVDRLEAGVAEGSAALSGAEVFLALRDALTEANDDWMPDPTRTSDAEETASDLNLYLRQMATDFHVIDDLAPKPHSKSPSPAHFNPEQREKELKFWEQPHIRVLSYATVGARAMSFRSGCPAPMLATPLDYAAALQSCGPAAGTDIAYRLCYRACAGGPFAPSNPSFGKITRVLGLRPPEPLELWDNDGIVNTLSMLWPIGETVLVQADHLDIVGHFQLRRAPVARAHSSFEPARTYEAYDALGSTPKLKPEIFASVWKEIFTFAAAPDEWAHRKKASGGSVAIAAAATGG